MGEFPGNDQVSKSEEIHFKPYAHIKPQIGEVKPAVDIEKRIITEPGIFILHT